MSLVTPTSSQTAKLEQALNAHRQGQLESAAALYREILGSNPAHFDSLHLLGVAEMQRGNNAEAVDLISKAIDVNKKNPGAFSNLAMGLRNLRRFEDALSACNKAIALQIDNVAAQYNRALILLDLERFEQALAGFRKTLQLNPNMAEAHTNMGVTLQSLGRFEEALESFAKALALQPSDANTQHNIGSTNQLLRRHSVAQKAFERAIALQPDHAEAHVGLSECLIQTGDYVRGWHEYEWRWEVPIIAPLRRDFAKPRWDGRADIAGKTLLLYAEQGLGDTIQFSRYIDKVRARGAKIVLEVQPALKTLFAGQSGFDTVIARGDALPDFDLHCPLLSLPATLETGGDFLPSPYLRAPAEAAAKWRTRMGTPQRKRCGLVWSGTDMKRGSGRFRSIPLEILKGIADAGVAFVGLQREVRDSDNAALSAFSDMNNLGSQLEDFADTAGVIENLDLVISVDTAVAHLAGAMGKPVWILLAQAPDWRWDINDGGDTTVWYPSARLFRQAALGDWASVINNVVTALKSGA